MKVLHADLGEGAEVFARFRREAEIASSLGHPHIVNVVDWNRLPDQTPFLVMEYLRGEDLHTRLARAGALPIAQVLELARQVGSALVAAHKHGVIHRDLKPQNIFLCTEDRGEEEVEVAKVLDFGISKILGGTGQESYTGAMRVMGTPLYMAPEQAMGMTANVDGRADQFALAAILYHALSGRRPFDGASVVEIAMKVMDQDPPPLAELVPGLPPHVDAALARALAKDREARFPSIAHFLRALGIGPGLSSPGLGAISGPRLSAPLARSDPSLPMVITPAALPAVTPLPDGAAGQLLRPRLLSEVTRRRLGLGMISLVAGLLSWGLVRSVGQAVLARRRPPAPVEAIAPPPPPVVRAPEVEKVRLQFVVTPPYAEVLLDGRKVSGPVEVKRGEAGLRLEVRAPGYLPQTDTVVPTSHQRILIRLVKKRPSSSGPTSFPSPF
jgi:serine/threonine-protein kinase